MQKLRIWAWQNVTGPANRARFISICVRDTDDPLNGTGLHDSMKNLSHLKSCIS